MRDYKLMLEQAISRASKASTQQIKVMGTMKHINENPIVNGIWAGGGDKTKYLMKRNGFNRVSISQR